MTWKFPSFSETALANISSSSDPAAMQAYGLILTGNIFQALAVSYVQIAVEGWDESQPQTYTDETGIYTVTWNQSGNTWTWTFEYNDGSQVLSTVISVEALDTGWPLVVSLDDADFLAGTLSPDGSEGQVTFFDAAGTAQVVATWGPSSVSGYDQNYTLSLYGSNGEIESELVADYTADGASGSWSYTDYLDSGNDGSDSW